MLSLHVFKKRTFRVGLILVAMIPTILLGIIKLTSFSFVGAVNYPMPAGFSDQVFYNAVVETFKMWFPNETISDSGLTDTQLAKITVLRYIGGDGIDKITNVDGIEKLTGLEILDLNSNQISTIDLSNNANLTELNLEKNALTSLNLAPLINVEELNISNNNLSTIDLSYNTALTELHAKYCKLSSIDFSNNNNLEKVDITSNLLTGTLDLSNRPSLTDLSAGHNEIATLNLSNDIGLKKVDANNNQISLINTSGAVALEELILFSNLLSSIDLSQNTALLNLNLSTNPISEIDLSHNTALKTFHANDDKFNTVDFSHNLGLENLYLKRNCDDFGQGLTSINLLANTNLRELELDENCLTSLDLTNNVLLKSVIAFDNNLTSINLPSGDALVKVSLYTNNLTSLDLSDYVNLRDIAVNMNFGLSELLLPATDSLTTVDASFCALSYLDVSNNPGLRSLDVQRQQGGSLTFMDVSHNIALTNFKADDISVKTNIKLASTGENTTFSLEDLRFLKSSQSISNTSDYTYSADTKTLTVIDGYNDLVQINSGSSGLRYKIMLPVYLAYDANGGSDVLDAEVCYLDGMTSCSITVTGSQPNRTGYYFLGWANSPSATSAAYSGGSIRSINGYTTVYAVWSPIYTLSFNLDGGTPAVGTQTCHPTTNITSSCNVTIPTTAVTKPDYEFFGYALTQGAKTPDYLKGDTYTFAGGGNRTATLYAVWGNSDATWQGGDYIKGITGDVTVTSSYPLNLLDKVLVDDEEVPANQYTVNEDSGEVIISCTYLDGLSAGNHTLTLVFTDGSRINLTFTVVVNGLPEPDDIAPSGDTETSENGDIVLNLTHPKAEVKSVTINIYDGDNNLVKTVDINDPGTDVRIDVSDLADGSYKAEIVHEDADGYILLVTTENFVKEPGIDIITLDVETEVDITERIIVEIKDKDGNIVRTVEIDVETGDLNVYDRDGNLLFTVENGYENGRLVVPMDGLENGEYDFEISFIDKYLRRRSGFVINDVEYNAAELPIPDTGPDTGRFTKVGAGIKSEDGFINPVVVAILLSIVASVLYGIKRYFTRKNCLTF